MAECFQWAVFLILRYKFRGRVESHNFLLTLGFSEVLLCSSSRPQNNVISVINIISQSSKCSLRFLSSVSSGLNGMLAWGREVRAGDEGRGLEWGEGTSLFLHHPCL